MGYRHVIQVVDSQTAGDPLRLIVGGIPVIRGASIKEKVAYLIRKQSHLLKATMSSAFTAFVYLDLSDLS
jgi:proline racemase